MNGLTSDLSLTQNLYCVSKQSRLPMLAGASLSLTAGCPTGRGLITADIGKRL